MGKLIDRGRLFWTGGRPKKDEVKPPFKSPENKTGNGNGDQNGSDRGPIKDKFEVSGAEERKNRFDTQ